MTNLQAVVGCAQMEQLDEFVVAKQRTRARYADALKDIPEVVSTPLAPWALSACWVSGVQVGAGATSSTKLVAALEAGGVESQKFWQPIHRQLPYADALRESLEICEGIADRFVALPCSTNLTVDVQDRVIDLCRRALCAT